MRLLRNTKTQEYFAHGAWTSNPALAQCFPDVRSMTAACLEFNLTDVELVMQYDLELSEVENVIRPVWNQQPRAQA